MLTQICRHIRNYFPTESVEGVFRIENGLISPDDILENGCCYLISGSRYNDGVHIHPDIGLKDEEFEGKVTMMAPPADFLELCREIEDWERENQQLSGVFVSESFGGYSYKRAENGGCPATWRTVFRDRLNDFRKL